MIHKSLFLSHRVKNDSLGQQSEGSYRCLLSRDTEKALRSERGPNRVATEDIFGWTFMENLTIEFVA